MARPKFQIVWSEGRSHPSKGHEADPIFGVEALKELGNGRHLLSDQLKKLPPVHNRFSRLNAARRRYVLGDDSALDET